MYIPHIRILAGAVFKNGAKRYSYFGGYFAVYVPYIYRNTVPEGVNDKGIFRYILYLVHILYTVRYHIWYHFARDCERRGRQRL